MKTLYVTQGNNILIDAENNKVNRLECCPNNISRIYLVEDKMRVIYGFGETEFEAIAEPGDIIINFYNDTDTQNNLIVVKSAEWTENLKSWQKSGQEEKLRWAAAKLKIQNNEQDNKSQKDE